MTHIAVAPIVEGHGDEKAVPVLLRRTFADFGRTPYVEVIRPIRIARSKLIQEDALLKAVDLADLKLRESSADRKWILVIFDADEEPACVLAPRLMTIIGDRRPHLDVSLVLAVPEYETWFVAAAESLQRYLTLDDVNIPMQPEQTHAKKAWLHQRFNSRYTETIEQAALTAAMDLRLCRSRAPSFDKLCREVEKRALPDAVVR